MAKKQAEKAISGCPRKFMSINVNVLVTLIYTVILLCYLQISITKHCLEDEEKGRVSTLETKKSS